MSMLKIRTSAPSQSLNEVYLTGTHTFNANGLPLGITLDVNWAQQRLFGASQSGWCVQLARICSSYHSGN